MTDVVQLEISEGIAAITLNRPDRLNAFDADAGHAWARATSSAVSDPTVRAILVRGAGRAFCAGGDVRAMAEMPDREDRMRELAGVINEGLLALLGSAVPVVAAAHGTTAGGGLGILLASDYAIVGESSRIGSRYANIGLTPDLSVSALLARAVGERRALQLALQDRMLTASEARDWGLAAEVVPDADVQRRARAIAREWADGPAEAYGQAKRLIRSQLERSLADQLAEEAATIGRMSIGPEATDRIAAFARR